jgi:hypothetical protein
MSGYMNRAAADSWIEAGPAVKARLEQIFAASGLPAGTVDRWTDDIVRNSFESAPAPASPLQASVEPLQ